MKKVLIVSYHFPPSESTGAVRPAKFVKYLVGYGWQPVVLTCKNSFDFGSRENPKLLNNIPKEVKIYRTRSIEPLNYIWRKRNNSPVPKERSVNKAEAGHSHENILTRIKGFLIDILRTPDREAGRVPFAVLKGARVVHEEKAGVIYATAPVPSALISGLLISKLTKVPLVVDYRDPWTTAFWAKRNFKIFEKINKNIEHAILKHASAVISVSNTRSNELSSEYSDIDPKKFVVIPNGYDRDDYPLKAQGLLNRLTFVHAGHIYDDSDVKNFLECIDNTVSKITGFAADVNVAFMGTRPNLDVFNRLEKAGVAIYIKRLPRDECLEYMARAHVLLAFLAKGPLAYGCVASKIFDYMLLNKKVLGIVPEGESAKIIRETKIGMAINPDDREVLAESICNIYRDYKNGGIRADKDEGAILRYDRKGLTGQLASILDEVVIK